MPSASERTELIVFQRATTADDDYGQPVETWADYATRRARVRFGTAQEKREAAQESASQTSTFECVRSSTLDGITTKDRIRYLPSADDPDVLSAWDIVETAPLDRTTIRFTGVRLA
jgi:SPP1 family predicted phage head-tail adaptor